MPNDMGVKLALTNCALHQFITSFMISFMNYQLANVSLYVLKLYGFGIDLYELTSGLIDSRVYVSIADMT